MHLRQRGLSLIELMIAITLGLILMTGVIQMFLSSQTVFHTQQAMSRIQENGRLGVEFIAKDIRMAGYMGCLNDSSAISNTLNSANQFAYRMNIGIEGYTAPLSGGETGMALAPSPIEGTDILVVRSAGGAGATVTQINDPAQVFATNTGAVAGACSANGTSYSGICTGDIVVVSDCFKGRVFQATSITPTGGDLTITHTANLTPGNAMASWGGGTPDMVFNTGADVLPVNHIVYFIAISPTTQQPSLYQNINGLTTLELLSGVEDMHLTYSRRAAPEDYQTAADLGSTAWSSVDNPVVSVRVQLLVRSLEDNVLEEPQTFVFPEGSAARTPDPVDRRMRQVFTNTVGIRSRLP